MSNFCLASKIYDPGDRSKYQLDLAGRRNMQIDNLRDNKWTRDSTRRKAENSRMESTSSSRGVIEPHRHGIIATEHGEW